jgi:hypothetical protein
MNKVQRAAILALNLAIGSALFSGMAACSRYSEEEAIFIAHNHSGDSVSAIVDGNVIAQLAPNSATNREIIVLVGRDPVRNHGYGPSQIDKQVQVSVVFKNARTGRLSRETTCTAGAKVKTTIIYEPQNGTDGYATCVTSYSY